MSATDQDYTHVQLIGDPVGFGLGAWVDNLAYMRSFTDIYTIHIETEGWLLYSRHAAGIGLQVGLFIKKKP